MFYELWPHLMRKKTEVPISFMCLLPSPLPDPVDLGVQVPVAWYLVSPTPRITWEHRLVCVPCRPPGFLCCLQAKVQTHSEAPEPSLSPPNSLILQAWLYLHATVCFAGLSPWNLPLIPWKSYSSLVPGLSCCITVSLTDDFVGDVRDIDMCGFAGP